MNPHFLLLVSAVVLVLLAIPLWRGWVPPNRWYGVRTRTTLSDQDRWYVVNASSGFDLLVSGIIVLIGIMVIESVGASWPAEFRNLAAALLLIVLLAGVSVRALRKAR
jgi:uncharacterized membrane protein